jgi:hypothetical protein
MFISCCSKCKLLTCLAHFFHKHVTGLVHIFNFFGGRISDSRSEDVCGHCFLKIWTIRTLVQQNRSDPRTTLCILNEYNMVYGHRTYRYGTCSRTATRKEASNTYPVPYIVELRMTIPMYRSGFGSASFWGAGSGSALK